MKYLFKIILNYIYPVAFKTLVLQLDLNYLPI